MEQNTNLAGKVAVVTGASSGIGEATVAALVRKGMRVAAVARRRERLDALAKRLAGGPGGILPIQADVADERQIHDAIANVVETWGQIDVLFANAGVMLLGPVIDANTEDWRRMINTNVLGLLYSVHAVLPAMVRSKSGHIITTSSVAGRVVLPRGAVYCASKFGVSAFSEGLRQEVLAHNIRVTTIEPGAVQTELADHITHEETRESMQKWLSSINRLRSEDIAAAVVYALEQPAHVNVNEILIRPTHQEL